MIKVPFPGVNEKATEWKFPYSDGFFSVPSDEFSITMARGSMGLTVSAFRSTKGTVDLQYMTYLGNAGFTNIYAFGYDSPTSVDSLSGVIGMKRIGDTTVIAAAACGQGVYEDVEESHKAERRKEILCAYTYLQDCRR